MANKMLFRFSEEDKSRNLIINSDGTCVKSVSRLSKYNQKWSAVFINRPIIAEQILNFDVESSQICVSLSSHNPKI